MSDLETKAAQAASEIGGKKMATKVVKKKDKKEKESLDGLIQLKELAKEAKVSPTSARVKLRGADVESDAGRWAWKKGSSNYKAARKALGL